MNKSLVVAAAGADGPRPTGMAVVTGAEMVRLEKFLTSHLVDATVLHMSHLPDGGVDKSVAQVEIARGADAQQPESRAAGIGLAHAGVQLFQRVVRVREAVLPALDREVAV